MMCVLQVCLLNYRKDGSTFLNQFFLSPIKVGTLLLQTPHKSCRTQLLYAAATADGQTLGQAFVDITAAQTLM